MEELDYPIAWKEEYSMQVKEIDDQHKHFVGILNNMYTAMDKIELEQKAEALLNDLKVYAGVHFATEEKYFDLFNYERAAEHKQQHRELTAKIDLFVQRYAQEGTAIVPEILDFMEDWLVNHLSIYDKKYVSCFKEHGL